MEIEAFGIEYALHGHNSVIETTTDGVKLDPSGKVIEQQIVENIHRHSLGPSIVLVVSYLVILVIGVCGNLIVVKIVISTPRMQTVTNYLICNLALADLCVLIFCLPPTAISNIYVPWIMGWFLCKTVPFVQGVTVCASIYTLVVISFERFLSIWTPLRCQMTKRRARGVIALIWLWASLLALPWLLYFDLTAADVTHPNLLFCVEMWPPGFNGNIYFVVVNLFLFYIFPLGIISFCYFMIWIRVWRRKIPSDSTISRIELIHNKAKVQVLRSMFVVVFAFILSWLPLYAIFTRYKLISTPLSSLEEEILALATPAAQWLGSSNSCINPLLYAFLNVKFRRAFYSLLQGGYKWERNPTPHYDKMNVLPLRKLQSQLQLQTVRIHTSLYNITEL